MNDDRVFTEFVKQLDESTAELPFEVIAKFRKLLRAQIRRRGLLQRSPSVLRYDGASWRDLDVLDCLVYDCFVAVILGVGEKTGQQLKYLKKQILVGNCIDALVTQKVGYFIHDLHRAAFPASAGIYKNLRKALMLATSAPESKLSLVGDPAEGIYGLVGSTAVPLSPEVLSDHVRTCSRWALVLPKVRRFSRVATNLTREAVEAMPEAGKTPFLFGDLKTVVTDNAFDPLPNSEYEAVAEFSDNEDQSPMFTRIVDAEDRYEKQQAELDNHVQRAIDAINLAPRRPKIREKMQEIVRRLAENVRRGRSVSQADVAREMNIAPQTLSDYMRFIRETVETATKPED